MWPRLPELIESLLQPVAKRDRELLACVETAQGQRCKAELSGVKSPHMYVRKHRGPDDVLRLRAAHLPTVHQVTSEESDRHKAMKDFMARTGQSAGLEVHVEKTTKNRTSRPDVTIIGAGGISLGCEAQYYNASTGTVLRRSKAHTEAGLVANWITHDDRFHLIDRSNWMLTRRMTWREISNAADIVLSGGFRVLAEWRCTASAERPCPNARENTWNTACGKMHLHWDTPRRLDDEGTGWTGHQGNTRSVTVGQTLVGAATGSVTTLFAPSRTNRRSGAYMWVPMTDLTRWNDYRGEEETAPEEDRNREKDIHFSGRDADSTCSFGDDTRIPSAPLERRGIYGVELTFTADDPAPVCAALPAPPRPQPQIPAQPPAPTAETLQPGPPDGPALTPPAPEAEPLQTDLPLTLIALQKAADLERRKLDLLDCHDARTRQRQAWFDAASTAQDAITLHARAERLNRFDVEQKVRRIVRDGDSPGERLETHPAPADTELLAATE
ncbi:hypothetical protein [Streptomyces sp. NPDC087294]|uniref:competence protein CoiA family protein n=1 Tax=Streptomyces sp. NPDC087294 TaxID=3365777 RepID=UPI0037FF3EFE